MASQASAKKVAGTDLPKLKVPKYRGARRDLIHLRNKIRYATGFAGDVKQTNGGISIQVPQLEDAWLDAIKYIYENGTCGEHDMKSYICLLYIEHLYEQMRGTQARKLWTKRKEADPTFDFNPETFGGKANVPGNYEHQFLQWFVAVINAVPLAVQMQIAFKLFPSSQPGSHVFGNEAKLTEALKNADIEKLIREEEELLQSMGNLGLNAAGETEGEDIEMT